MGVGNLLHLWAGTSKACMEMLKMERYCVWINCAGGTILMSIWETLEKALKEKESLDSIDDKFTYFITFDGERIDGKDNDL